LSITLGIALITLGSSYFQQTRFTAQTKLCESYPTYSNPYRQASCFLTSNRNSFSLFDQKNCVNTDPEKFNILLIGDSHTDHWFSALNENLQENQTLLVITASDC
jgi:hypothetical protein